MSTVQKQLIRRSITRCARQRRIDALMTLLSFVGINAIIIWLYGQKPLVLIPFIFLACIVHLGVVLYCNHLWRARMKKWEAIERWCSLAEGARQAISLKGELQFSPPVLEDTAE